MKKVVHKLFKIILCLDFNTVFYYFAKILNKIQTN